MTNNYEEKRLQRLKKAPIESKCTPWRWLLVLALLTKVEGFEAISSSPTPSEPSLVLKWRRVEVLAHNPRVSKTVLGLRVDSRWISQCQRKKNSICLEALNDKLIYVHKGKMGLGNKFVYKSFH